MKRELIRQVLFVPFSFPSFLIKIAQIAHFFDTFWDLSCVSGYK